MIKSKTIFCDIDGTLIKHHGTLHDQLRVDAIILEKTIEKLSDWDSKGYNIILTTGRRESQRAETVTQLKEVGIFYDQLIMGIGGGARVLVNDRKADGTDTAFAFNIDRNRGIGEIDV